MSVVPSCALVACGGPDPLLDANDAFFGNGGDVAADAFCCFVVRGGRDVAEAGFAQDAADAADATDLDGDAADGAGNDGD